MCTSWFSVRFFSVFSFSSSNVVVIGWCVECAFCYSFEMQFTHIYGRKFIVSASCVRRLRYVRTHLHNNNFRDELMSSLVSHFWFFTVFQCSLHTLSLCPTVVAQLHCFFFTRRPSVRHLVSVAAAVVVDNFFSSPQSNAQAQTHTPRLRSTIRCDETLFFRLASYCCVYLWSFAMHTATGVSM